MITATSQSSRAVRYWVIAPVESQPADRFDSVWQFDLENNLISIGWSELGDVSRMNREQLSEAVAAKYPGIQIS